MERGWNLAMSLDTLVVTVLTAREGGHWRLLLASNE